MKKTFPIIFSFIIIISILLLIFIPKYIEANNIFNSLITDNCNHESLLNLIKYSEPSNKDELITDNLEFNKIIERYNNSLPFLKTISYIGYEIITNDENIYTSKLPSGYTFSYESNNISTRNIKINYTFNNSNYYCIGNTSNSANNHKVNIIGNNDGESVNNNINEFWNNFKNDLNINSINFNNNVITNNTTIINEAKNYLSNYNFNNINYLDNEISNSIVLLGSIDLVNNTNTSDKESLNLYFNFKEDKYLFDISDLNLLVLNILKKNNKSINLNCSDCLLAPVSKQFSLKSNYSPTVINTGLNGGGKLNSISLEYLKKLYNDAKDENINISIISAYRSYSDQVNTFNYWVNREIATGLSKSAATLKANNYSAMPGQSEHQLATTVDLKCSNCSSFDNSNENLKLYKFLKENAHKYGFVISYPENKKHLTGYNTELWHIRYIGIDLATEIFNLKYLENNDMYLTKFLLMKNTI